MRIAVTFLAATFLAAAPALAENDQVQRAPAPSWVRPSELMPVPDGASGLVFVRRQDSLIHLDGRGQAQYFGYRIRILHPNALQLGNLALAWNPAAGAPTVHSIRVHRGGETIDVLDGATFEIIRREDQLEAATLTGILTAVLRVADLRVGDELEFEATIRSSDPTLGGNDAGLLFLPPEMPSGRFALGISWDEGQEPQLRMTPDMAAAAQRRDRGMSFRFDDPPMITPPQGAPPRYRWQRVVEYSDFPDWPAISRHFAPLYDEAATLGDDSALKSEARRIAAAHSDPLDRAAAALRLVQQQVRYIYVGLDGGNLTPASAEITWQRRYGDCKGKTALLLALLTELDIDAAPVLVNNSGGDDGLDERLPNPGMFDHVLIQARIGGTTYWLDGTLPAAAGPSLEPVVPYRWILPLTARGNAIESLPWRAAEVPEEVQLYEIDARAGFDQPARIRTTMIVRGIAGLQAQTQMSALTPAQLLGAMRQQMVGDTFQTIDDAQWRYDPDARASILTISGTGAVDWDVDGNGGRSLALPGGGFNPPERRVRPVEQDQELPFYNDAEFTCSVTTVRLPSSAQKTGWTVTPSYNSRFFGRNYYRAFELREGAIRMVRAARVEQREIDAETAKRDNARIATFDNSMAWISYDPAGRATFPGTGVTVPATYEIDWTASDAPCLASTGTIAGRSAPAASPGEPVRARANLGNLITYADYPLEALRTSAQGTVRVRLSIDSSGVVTGCEVTSSSGHDILDDATCTLLRRRAVFIPARDDLGRTIPDTVNSPPIRWSIQPAPPAAQQIQ